VSVARGYRCGPRAGSSRVRRRASAAAARESRRSLVTSTVANRTGTAADARTCSLHKRVLTYRISSFAWLGTSQSPATKPTGLPVESGVATTHTALARPVAMLCSRRCQSIQQSRLSASGAGSSRLASPTPASASVWPTVAAAYGRHPGRRWARSHPACAALPRCHGLLGLRVRRKIGERGKRRRVDRTDAGPAPDRHALAAGLQRRQERRESPRPRSPPRSPAREDDGDRHRSVTADSLERREVPAQQCFLRRVAESPSHRNANG
jgi:hypothetical protein